MIARDRTLLWSYLGSPEGEPPERRRVLYAGVALRLGLGLSFLARGWGALFAAPPSALATRLGDVTALGIHGAPGREMVLFILGCTELGVGLLLLFGAFSRVSAVTGSVLLALYLTLGDREVTVVAPALAMLGGLLLLVICGSPFLSADRFLDKVEEEERDRAPAVLPALAPATPLLPRLGLAAGLGWLALALLMGGTAPGQGLPAGALVAGVALALPIALGLVVRVAGLLGGALLAWSALAAPHDRFSLIVGVVTVALAVGITGAGTVGLAARWDRR